VRQNFTCYLGYERKVRDWMVVRELIVVLGGFLEEWKNNRFFENGVNAYFVPFRYS